MRLTKSFFYPRLACFLLALVSPTSYRRRSVFITQSKIKEKDNDINTELERQIKQMPNKRFAGLFLLKCGSIQWLIEAKKIVLSGG